MPEDDEKLALRLRALAHPARLAIVRALAREDRCHCGQIVRGLTLAQSTVSQHLKVLKEAGLIDGTVEGPRSCYCLDRAAFAELGESLGELLGLLSALPADPAQSSPAPCEDEAALPALAEGAISAQAKTLIAKRPRLSQRPIIGSRES